MQKDKSLYRVSPLRLGVFIYSGLAACFTLSYFLYIVISGTTPITNS